MVRSGTFKSRGIHPRMHVGAIPNVLKLRDVWNVFLSVLPTTPRSVQSAGAIDAKVCQSPV